MGKVNITITVDTDKLKSQSPGEITDRTIVVMTDDQPDSIYKDSQGDKYKDKLTSASDPGDMITWEIEAKNGKDKLVLIKCEESTEFSNMMDEQPSEDEEYVEPGETVDEQKNAKGKKKWKAKLKNSLGKSVYGFYKYKLAYKNDSSTTWEWDPGVITRPVI